MASNERPPFTPFRNAPHTNNGGNNSQTPLSPPHEMVPVTAAAAQMGAEFQATVEDPARKAPREKEAQQAVDTTTKASAGRQLKSPDSIQNPLTEAQAEAVARTEGTAQTQTLADLKTGANALHSLANKQPATNKPH